ncbi:MAG: peptide chain release factor N(5)-glutamine methyltransferase [Ruminococcaceae bacterium]|nr:peptide chain release factor N(5)-glutamine methyltransferase [Oscillospiraceae bacterium]
MTLRELTETFTRAGIDNAAYEARLLAEHFTGIPAHVVYTTPDQPLADPDGALARAAEQRAAHYPLQYLIGTWGFWRQEYEVSPDCLIPRPDTELLVEYAARHLPRGGRVIDLCTGSGCISISLLCERPDLSAVAVDLFEGTLAVAERNARRNGIAPDRLTLLRGDVLRGDFMAGLGAFDAILSNPPYITTAAMQTLAPELSFEPPAALCGGEDGLIFYRRILDEPYRTCLLPGGCYLFEIGYDQGDALRALAAQRGDTVAIHRDLGGQERMAVVTPPHTL